MSQTILDQILTDKYQEVQLGKAKRPVSELQTTKKVKSFLSSYSKDRFFLIAEIKKASPSKGIIREDFNPVDIARHYQNAGAGAISVLTDSKYFKGELSYLQAVSKAVEVPLLRKDFIIDPYQIAEARYAGASAVLLIVAALKPSQIEEYIHIAKSYDLDSLVEVHDEAELNIALERGAGIIGINNRDLKTFHTDITLTERLRKRIPDDKIIISESGINTAEDINYLKSLGVHGALIGEAFMREKDIEKKVRSVMGS